MQLATESAYQRIIKNLSVILSPRKKRHVFMRFGYRDFKQLLTRIDRTSDRTAQKYFHNKY